MNILYYLGDKVKRLGYLMIGVSEHGMDLFNNTVKTGTRDISGKKAGSFIDSIEIDKEGITLFPDEIDNYVEQYIYRNTACPGCKAPEGCPHCECIFPLKKQTPSQECPEGRWGEMLPKDEWEKFKLDHGINIQSTIW